MGNVLFSFKAQTTSSDKNTCRIRNLEMIVQALPSIPHRYHIFENRGGNTRTVIVVSMRGSAM